MMNCS